MTLIAVSDSKSSNGIIGVAGLRRVVIFNPLKQWRRFQFPLRGFVFACFPWKEVKVHHIKVTEVRRLASAAQRGNTVAVRLVHPSRR